MNVSGPKRGHANLTASEEEARIFGVFMRSESAFNAPPPPLPCRHVSPSRGDARGFGRFRFPLDPREGKISDKIVIQAHLGDAYSVLMGRHERSVERSTSAK